MFAADAALCQYREERGQSLPEACMETLAFTGFEVWYFMVGGLILIGLALLLKRKRDEQ